MEEITPHHAPVASGAALRKCHLCGLSFDTAEEKRQHAKSEWHVDRIRRRVAESGASPTVPLAPAHSESKPPARQRKRERQSLPEPRLDDEGSDEDSEGGIWSDKECLFCSQASWDFNSNLAHMRRVHGFGIPFQSSLAVDLETLICALHMIIFTYRECISCGTRRRTTEAVQQHMMSTGHCRFDPTSEMSEFYRVDSLAQLRATVDSYSRPDDHTLRLPSGKLLTSRAQRREANFASTSRRRVELSPVEQGSLPAPRQHTDLAAAQGLTTKRDWKEQALTIRFARLRREDQLSLGHLAESEQRSILAIRQKKLDEQNRGERRARGRLDKVGNKTLVHTRYYKQEVPVYLGG
ncbi:hypothetical protein VTK26DRAFT_6788 [Humicola hyalothermophila]